jgi:hypothetical protein
VRLLGGVPCLAVYWSTHLRSRPVMDLAREENLSMTCGETLPTSAPFPSALGHGVSHGQQTLFEGPVGGDAVQVAELVEVLPVGGPPLVVGTVGPPTALRIARWTCSCGSPSRLIVCGHEVATRPSSMACASPSRAAAVV